MMRILLIILSFLFSTIIHSQNNHYLKLIDSYSYNQISLNESLSIKKGSYSIDSTNNLILIKNIKRNRLILTIDEYQTYDDKIKLKRNKKDTISLTLIPIDSIVQCRYEQHWNSDSLFNDTIVFNGFNELENHLSSYLKYLMFHLNKEGHACDNGLCNYSNTYRYNITFSGHNNIFEIIKIEKLQPQDSICIYLEQYIPKLIEIYPKIGIKNLDKNSNKFSIPLTIMMF